LEDSAEVDDAGFDAERAPAGDGALSAADAVAGVSVPDGHRGQLRTHLERADAGESKRKLVCVFVGDADVVDVSL
jgi:hypothetical protein